MASLELAKILNLPKLPGYLKLVDKELKSSVDPANPALKKPLQQVIKSNSKRFRSSLLIASALGAKVDNNLIIASTAIELAHLGSLVHDDIIDSSNSRWDQPTTNSSVGTAQALLVGDYLLAKSCLQAAKLDADAAELLAETIAILAAGEAMEIKDINKFSRPLNSYFSCIKAKSAALISTACYLGGVCGNLSAAQASCLGQYGESLGVSFQIIDDLMDLLSTPGLMGKPTASDAQQGIYTLPVLLSLNGPNQKALKALLAKTNVPNDKLVNLLIADGSIQKSITQAKKYNQQAVQALDQFSNKDVAGLKALPDAYLHWALSNLITPTYWRLVS